MYGISIFTSEENLYWMCFHGILTTSCTYVNISNTFYKFFVVLHVIWAVLFSWSIYPLNAEIPKNILRTEDMVSFYATIHYFSLVSNLLFIYFGLFFRIYYLWILFSYPIVKLAKIHPKCDSGIVIWPLWSSSDRQLNPCYIRASVWINRTKRYTNLSSQNENLLCIESIMALRVKNFSKNSLKSM